MLFQMIFPVMPMFVCLFWAFLFPGNKNLDLPKRFLIFFFLLSALNFFAHAAYFLHDYKAYAFLENIWVFTALARYPLIYYYIRLLTRDSRIQWRWSWILVPAFIISAFSFVLYFMMSEEELNTFLHGFVYRKSGYDGPFTMLVQLQAMRILVFRIFFLIELVLVLYFSARLILDYNREIRNFYSNVGGKSLNRVQWVLDVIILITVISFLSELLGKEYFISRSFLLAITSILHTVVLFALGYVGYYQQFTINEFNRDREAIQASISEKPAETIVNRLSAQVLDKLMTDEGLFKNPDLRITDVASRAMTNRTYVSRIINDEMKTNFRDWINSYRIAYAAELLDDPAKDYIPIVEISEHAGFTGTSVFYKVFRKKYNLSPGEYRKKRLMAS